MTAQINDTCFHRKIELAIAGISGSGLFDPATIGIQPEATSTNCWRGYVAHYSILDGALFLTKLQIERSQDYITRAGTDKGPEIFGVLATTKSNSDYLYEGFQSHVPFTGGLLLADGFIDELYVHMGFQSGWKYQYVRDVRFEAGRVIGDVDRSTEMAAIRKEFLDDFKRSGRRLHQPPDGDIEAWIDRCFSREYQIPDDVAARWEKEFEGQTKRKW